MTDVLHFAGLTVTRDGATLLDGVDWAVTEGDRWVVLGPNGAGKTTLLQVASANLHPTAGQAWVLGERMGAVDVFDLRPRVGLTSATLADRVPARELVENVVLTASYAVVGRHREAYDLFDQTRAEILLRQMGIADLRHRRFGTLSEGERKRTQVARALMTDPELLLLDEPAAGLDLAGREDLLRRLGILANDLQAPAMVLVTHHVEEIPPGFTHVLLLRDGRVIAQGPLESALTTQTLSLCFGLPLDLDQRNGRWAARLAG
ncbi:MAG: ABC transporter ATP-binding protein [Actinomycetes bacterium]